MNKNVYDTAMWLANPTSMGATDEEFVETIVLMEKIRTQMKVEKSVNMDLTADDIKSFDIDRFVGNLKDILEEIIHSPEIDESAWWKKAS